MWGFTSGRFKNIARELRFCRVCNKNIIESEYHHLLHCEKLSHIRDIYKVDLFNKVKEEGDPDDIIVKRIQMLLTEHIKITGSSLQAMMDERSVIFYNKDKNKPQNQAQTQEAETQNVIAHDSNT